MPRILAIDYGKKRTGLAVTDPLKIIASGLTTVLTHELIPYLRQYLAREPVELFVLGEPKDLQGRPTDATALAAQCRRSLAKHFPTIPVIGVDERFSSKMAARSLVDGGVSKKDRRDKGLVDEVSATILLQSYLQSI